MTHILLADDEVNLSRVLAAQLSRDGYEVTTVGDGMAALGAVNEHHIDVLITDLRMPKLDGMRLLEKVTASHPEIPVIMITAHGTVDTAVEALKLGAFDYVTKPFDRSELKHAIDKAARTRELSRGYAVSGTSRGRYRIIGEAAPMLAVYDIIERVADTPSTVLITGESGTGKELIAQALHDNSARAGKPFIRVNCAAIPPDLLESELFGYERGAFTGAVTSKPGRFELAHDGSLFLDEIGEIPVSMQVKLLRAIQEQEFERVGGIKTIKTDVRLIAATNRDLLAEIDAGRFREDLYYRLNVVQMNLPPLRERISDIPLLCEHFIAKFNERLKRDVRGLDALAHAALSAHAWRGNIRELENVIERCMLFCDGDVIEAAHLPPELQQSKANKGGLAVAASGTVGPLSLNARVLNAAEQGAGLKEAVREATSELERELIERALKQTGNNVTHAARILKISRKSLQTKMKEHGLAKPQA